MKGKIVQNNFTFWCFAVNNFYFPLFMIMNNPTFSPMLLTTPPNKILPATTGDMPFATYSLSSSCCHHLHPFYFISPFRHSSCKAFKNHNINSKIKTKFRISAKIWNKLAIFMKNSNKKNTIFNLPSTNLGVKWWTLEFWGR